MVVSALQALVAHLRRVLAVLHIHHAPKNDMSDDEVKPLAPGAWVDWTGALHLNLADMLEYLGVEDTPRNREELAAIARRVVLEESPATRIIEREEEGG
jgi:hypothetical protein